MLQVVLKYKYLIAGTAVILLLEAMGIYYGKFNQTQADDAVPFVLSKTSDNKSDQALRQKINSLAPSGIHIVIDSAQNKLYLKKGNVLLREAVISTGSGSKLKDPNQEREWTFDTPRGVFAVSSKKKNPLWVKPDWAFIEEGKVPPKDIKERFEYGMLGDYALGFGDGYFIHGTLYSRLLGRNVSHGCVRVGDKDLQAIYNATPMGAKIFIF